MNPSVNYKVNGGDTLWGLAQKYTGNGANYSQIQALNPGLNPRALGVGSTIKLPSDWNTGLQGSTYGTPAKPSSSSSSSSSSNAANPNSTNYNDVSNYINSIMNPAQNKAMGYLKNAAGQIPTIYNQAIATGQNQMSTNTNQTNSQIANNQSTLTQEEQATGAATRATEAQLGSAEQATAGNVGASAAARGWSAGDPFTSALKVASQQPYFQEYNTLNAATTKQIAQEAAAMAGVNTNLVGDNMTANTNIADSIMKLAPQEAAQIVSINNDMANTIYQFKNGAISAATALYKINTGNHVIRQQIAEALQATKISAAAQVQSAQTTAGATIGAANIAGRSRIIGTTTTSNHNGVPGTDVVTGINPKTGQPEVTWFPNTTNAGSDITTFVNHYLGNIGKNPGNFKVGGMTFNINQLAGTGS